MFHFLFRAVGSLTDACVVIAFRSTSSRRSWGDWAVLGGSGGDWGVSGQFWAVLGVCFSWGFI